MCQLIFQVEKMNKTGFLNLKKKNYIRFLLFKLFVFFFNVFQELYMKSISVKSVLTLQSPVFNSHQSYSVNPFDKLYMTVKYIQTKCLTFVDLSVADGHSLKRCIIGRMLSVHFL